MRHQVSLEDRQRGASVRQCARLLATLREVAKGPLRITLDGLNPESETPELLLLLEEQVTVEPSEILVWHVWSSKRFNDSGYLISYGALFDLLIVGYTRMAAEYGDPYA